MPGYSYSSCFSLVSSFARQLQPLWDSFARLFVVTIGDRDNGAFANERTVEDDGGDLRQRLVFDTGAGDLIVDPDDRGQRADREWTTVDGNSPGFVDDVLAALN